MDEYFQKKERDAELWRLMKQMPEMVMGVDHKPPRVWSVPLPSSVHLAEGDAPPWHAKPPITRPWLMSYTGSLEGAPESQRLRRYLVSKCKVYGEPLCKVARSARSESNDTAYSPTGEGHTFHAMRAT